MELQRLTTQQVIGALRSTPEQATFDWKRKLELQSDEQKGEFLKDIAAIANAPKDSPGYIFYGVNPNERDERKVLHGQSDVFDDAKLQQLVKGKIEPEVPFLYYELQVEKGQVGVLHVPMVTKRPHIITKDIGKVRQGQIPIRRGSSTEGISFDDLYSIFYSSDSPYLGRVLHQYEVSNQQETNRLHELDILCRERARLERQFREEFGL